MSHRHGRAGRRVAALLVGALTGLGMVLVVPATAQASTTLSFAPTEDTFVTSLQPTGNFSTSATMRANGNPEKISLVKFNVTGIPTEATNVTANLVLHGVTGTTTQTATVKNVTTSWTGSTVTYSTKPTLGSVVASGSISAGGTLTIPVAAVTNGNKSWAVTAAGTTDAVFATSEDANSALRPSLVVTYTDAPPPPPPPAPLYGTDGNGNPSTSDCTTTVTAGGSINSAIAAATPGAVICVNASDDSTQTVTLNKAVTVRATGIVKIKNAVLSGGSATLDGFTIVGGTAGNPSAGVLFSGDSNVVTNNLINGHGLERGVYCTSCGTGTVISRNTITKVNGYGIQTGNGTANVIEWNNIYDLYDTADNGLDVDAMRPFGTNVVVRNNYMHDINAARSILGSDNDLPHTDCIQHYQSGTSLISNGLLVENNYCVRVSGMFIISKNNQNTTTSMQNMTIRGNVVETYGWQNIILSGVPNVVIENNTLFGAPKGGPGITIENGDAGAQAANVRIQNNVIVRGDSTNPPIGNKQSNATPTGVVTVNRNNVTWVDTTLADRDAAWASDTSGAANAPAINLADFTFYLNWEQQGGTLLDQGATLLSSGFVQDVAGATRVQGTAVDVGAYELG